MENLSDVSSEEELLELCNEGKISDTEYQDLLAVMRKPASDEHGNKRIWRSGNILVMHRNAVLPDRCVKTNEPALGRRLKRKLYWHHPALYLLIFVNILIYVIVALVVRERAIIEIGVSEKSLSRRKTAIIISVVAFLTGVGFLVFAYTKFNLPHAAIVSSAFAMFLISIVAAYKTCLIAPKRIETDYVWIKGVCKEYLASLPEWETR